MWVLNREEKQSTLCYICILCQRLLATSDPRVKPNQGHPIDHVVPHPLSKLSQVRWMLLRRGVLGLRRCNLRRGCCLLLLLGRQGLVCLQLEAPFQVHPLQLQLKVQGRDAAMARHKPVRPGVQVGECRGGMVKL